MIFLSRPRLHAAGDVNSVGANDANCGSYVFDVETACQNDTAANRGPARHVPIGSAACTTILACMRGVKQKGIRLGVFIESGQGKIRLDAESFEDRETAGQLRNIFRGFVAVQLRGMQLQRLAESGGLYRRRVDEYPHCFELFRKVRANLCGFGFGDMTWAFRVKIETKEIGTRIDGGEGVGRIGDAADFDADHG